MTTNDYIYLSLASALALIGGFAIVRNRIRSYRLHHAALQHPAAASFYDPSRGPAYIPSQPQENYPNFAEPAPPGYVIPPPPQKWWEDKSTIIAILTFLTLLVNTYQSRQNGRRVEEVADKTDVAAAHAQDASNKASEVDQKLEGNRRLMSTGPAPVTAPPSAAAVETTAKLELDIERLRTQYANSTDPAERERLKKAYIDARLKIEGLSRD